MATPGNEDLLHHMEVFHCVGGDEDPDEEFPLWAGPCGSDVAPEPLKRCKKVLAAWAVGAGPFVYPEEAGLAVGGEDFGPYLMLEVHYNNQDRLRGRLDRSGLRLTVTRDLRPHDAGIMELGLVYGDAMAIPPGQEEFSLSGHCVPGCTMEVVQHLLLSVLVYDQQQQLNSYHPLQGFPSSGVTFFGSQLHTHATGIRVATRHFRDGRELPEVNRDDHYSTHFQEIRVLRKPRKILPVRRERNGSTSTKMHANYGPT